MITRTSNYLVLDVVLEISPVRVLLTAPALTSDIRCPEMESKLLSSNRRKEYPPRRFHIVAAKGMLGFFLS